MSAVQSIVFCSVLWLFFLLVLRILLKSEMYHIRKNHRILIQPVRIVYEMLAANDILATVNCKSSSYWFDTWLWCGVFVMIVSLVLTTLYSLYYAALLFIAFTASTEESTGALEGHSISALIPGVNYPPEELPILTFCMLMMFICHEMGHASAAYHFGVEVTSFGVFLTFIFPGAFITIDNSHKTLSSWTQVKLYSAGIMNNYLLAGIFMIIYLLMQSTDLLTTFWFYDKFVFILWLNIQLNLSLALLNSLPVLGLDGGKVLKTLMQTYTSRKDMESNGANTITNTSLALKFVDTEKLNTYNRWTLYVCTGFYALLFIAVALQKLNGTEFTTSSTSS